MISEFSAAIVICKIGYETTVKNWLYQDKIAFILSTKMSSLKKSADAEER